MKKIEKYRLGLISVLIIVLSFVGIFAACADKEGKTMESEADRKEQWAMISYVGSYDNIGALAGNSDKIAVVQVLDERFEEPVVGNYATRNRLKVIRPIYNCETGEEIEFSTPSGVKDSVFYQSNHTTLLEKGKIYLLFMEEAGEGKYASSCGDDGRFLVEDGKITSTHHESVRSKWEDGSVGTAHIVNRDLDELVQTITHVLSLKEPEKLAPGAEFHEYETNDQPSAEYSSWEQLMKDSEAVCVVFVGDFHNGYPEENEPDGFYFDATVELIYSGNIEPGTSLMLETKNFCGDDGESDTEEEIVDDPWMFEGEKYLVFLKRSTDGMYQIVGDAQGRFAVQDGKITALKYLYPGRVTKGLDVKDLELKE